MENRVFFSQKTLDDWLSAGKVDLRGSELTIIERGRRYEICEALYFAREVTEANDAHNVVGRVKARALLDGQGAEIFDTSCILGDNAYDVVPGFTGFPSTPYDEHRRRRGAAPTAGSDEALLRSLVT